MTRFKPLARYRCCSVSAVAHFAQTIEEHRAPKRCVRGLASLAKLDREQTVERTRAGLEVARKLGRVGGRKRQMTGGKIESAKRLLSNGVPPRDVAHNLAVCVPTFYR